MSDNSAIGYKKLYEQDLKAHKKETEVQELIYASSYVKPSVHAKLPKPNRWGIIIGTMPERVTEKETFYASVVAKMAGSKYMFGMHLHLQIDQFK